MILFAALGRHRCSSVARLRQSQVNGVALAEILKDVLEHLLNCATLSLPAAEVGLTPTKRKKVKSAWALLPSPSQLTH